MDNSMLVAVVVLLALVAAGAWLWSRRQQSERIRQRFGPEYERALHRHGDPAKAEAELREREKRVQKLHIVPLAPSDAAHFSNAWRGLQARFIDNPKGSLMEADELVRELMLRRGYPMGDFEHRAADISVHHPSVVEHYRAAHAIARRDHRGEADTEDLRQAIVHYRALFDELLEVGEPPQRDDHRAAQTMEVHH